MFSKTLLRTSSLALNVRGFTRRLYQLANLYWYEAMRMVAASRSSSIMSKSLIMASVLVPLGIPVRIIGIQILVGMIAFIPYVRVNGDSSVGF